MDISPKLKSFLDERRIPYSLQVHAESFTAQETAATAHVPGRSFAKPVILSVDGALWMAVVPAHQAAPLRRIERSLGAREVRVASEGEFAPVFDDCETGAMPVFGSLYGVPVIAAEELTRAPEIAFNAGSHHVVIRIRTSDYLNAEQPRILERAEAA